MADAHLDPGVTRCHCGGGASGDLGYEACCGPLHRADAEAATAEELMRARYSAYVELDEAYLRRSWHPDRCPPVMAPLPTSTWLGLTIDRVEGGGQLDTEGVVAFTARFRTGPLGGPETVIGETSRFGRLGGRWVYLDGTPHRQRG